MVPAQESHGSVRAGLVETHKHNHRAGAPLLWKQPKIAQLGEFILEKRKLQGGLIEPSSTYRRLIGKNFLHR